MTKTRHRSRRPLLSAGRKALIPILALLILAAPALLLLSTPFPRLELSGFRITEEEYLRAMYQARNDVLSDHSAAGISLTDWSAGTELGDPCQLTTDRALEILAEYYAVSLLAAERGYLADPSYAAMEQDLADLNRQRQAALDAGSMVTGIPHFTVEDYLTYRASNIRLQFCNDPENPENQVTPEEIRQRYEADRDNLYRQPDSMELAFVLLNDADDSLVQAAQSLRQKALETGTLAAALGEFPQLQPYFQEISVNPGTYSVYARSHGDVLYCAEGLRSGDISRVFSQEGWLCLVQCLERHENLYAPLEEVQSVVVQSIRESRYDDLIAERMESMEISGNLEALCRFTAKQLP